MDFTYLIEHWRRVLDLGIDHLEISATAMAIAIVIAIPIGVLAARIRPLTLPILGVLGALYTVPSLAFLAFLIPSLGLGRKPAIVVLVTYAQIFLVRNVVAGLRGVNRDTLEAARGLGMTGWQVFRKIQWPLALPVVLAGIRTAFVTTISLTTITQWINAGGLGRLLFDGLTRLYSSEILAGAIAITTLALLVDAVLRAFERFTAVSRANRAVRR